MSARLHTNAASTINLMVQCTLFGCEIMYKPSSLVILTEMRPLGSKLLPGIFLGYYTRPGGLYDGDLFFADWDDIANAALASSIPIRRAKAWSYSRTCTPGKYSFPLAGGCLSQPPSPFCTRKLRSRRCRIISFVHEDDLDPADSGIGDEARPEGRR